MNEPLPESDALQDDLERLFRRIAPADLGSRPCYVAMASTMPADLRPGAEVLGYHCTFLDITFRSWLVDSGRWRGRGPAVVINDIALQAIAEQLGGDDVDLVAELYRDRVHALLFHEIAHALSQPFDLRPVPTEIADTVERDSRAAVVQWITTRDEMPADPPPHWIGHEAAFIRTLLHIVARAERLGVKRPADGLMFASFNYSLSGLWCYRSELAKEIESFDSSLCFADLRLCHPPIGFIRLWRDDLKRWWQWSQDELGPIYIAAAMAPYVHVLTTD
jgi:hypothetical protein